MIQSKNENHLLTWLEFEAMTYDSLCKHIMGDVDSSIQSWLRHKGFPLKEVTNKGMYQAYVDCWIFDNTPLGRALS